MADRRPEPARRSVEIEVDGKSIDGTYTVHSGVVTVSHPLCGSKTAHLGSIPAHTLAQQLLAELVAAEKKK